MPAPTMTPELQKVIQLLKLRSIMDPKRHYKKGDSQTAKYFQVGTVVESPSEFFSSRLTKKERKATVADELLSDPALAMYRKRKVHEIEEKNRPADNEKWKNEGKTSYKSTVQSKECTDVFQFYQILGVEVLQEGFKMLVCFCNPLLK